VYQTLLNLRGDRVQVARRAIFKVISGESYEIDVYYEFERVGVRHRVAIECKDWKAPVDQGRVLEFHQKIKNIGDNIVGVLVSRAGYQSGALSVAKRHGILALSGNDVPSIGAILSNQITAALLPERHCIGEPFWYLAELCPDDPSQGTGSYYSFEESAPVRIPLFISKRHAAAYLEGLPDSDAFGVFGMPQYKLRALLGMVREKDLRFGIVCAQPKLGDPLVIVPMDSESMKSEFLFEE
jgi:hypothetical protein